MIENKQKEVLEPIEICFGMVTENTFQGKTTQHVIVELGEKNYCSTSEIITIDGEKVLTLVGTAGLEEIHNVTGEVWSKEQVLEAYNRYFKNYGGVPESMIEIIEQNSVMPPRILI